MIAFIAGIAIAALALMIGIEIAVIRNRNKKKKKVVPRHPRRQPLLEDRMRAALEEPHAQYGEVFTSYMVWKRGQETRMELFTGPPWMNLNEFTRAIVVRHVWRALEKLAKGSVVIVDQPPQQWSSSIDARFDDRGIDPWGEQIQSAGPQFIKDN